MITIEDLHRAIDALIVRQRIKLWREQRAEWHTLPSLWEQLEAATGYQGTGSGHGGGRDRLPISTDVVALIIRISSATSEAVMEHAGETRRTVPGNLRLLATRLPQAGRADEFIDWWTTEIRDWTRDARAALRLDAPRPRWARGTPCPHCGADTINARQDGEPVRRPALAIQWTPGDEHLPAQVRAITCDACHATWWRGPDLDGLVQQMLTANATRDTLTG